MIIKKSILRILVPTIIYVLVIASNNITVPGYGRPSILLHIFLIFLAIYLYFFYSKRPSYFILPGFLQFVFFILIISSIVNSFVINDYRIVTTYFSFMFIFLTLQEGSRVLFILKPEVWNYYQFEVHKVYTFVHFLRIIHILVYFLRIMYRLCENKSDHNSKLWAPE